MMFSDVLIIGAGPCGLAVAARLHESTPSALFTDDEHTRYWKKFNRKNTLEAERKRKVSNDGGTHRYGYHASPKSPQITVLDAMSSQWLESWRRRFSKFEISHLRSPLFFHPDPRDKDGLLAYAYDQGRLKELNEIEHVTGKEYSKHRRKKEQQRGRKSKVGGHLRIDGRDQIDYFNPSTKLFEDYCWSIVDRYKLRDIVHHAQVFGVQYDDIGCPSSGRMFQVDTTNGTYLAKILVIATGATSSPCIPADHNLSISSNIAADTICHCFSPIALDMHHSISGKLSTDRPTKAVIVGGGLTSAQLAHLLIRQGISHVWLIMRSKYKLKQFDVDLEWVSKVRNQRMAEFWSAETVYERTAMLKEAKNGGSITSAFDKILQQHIKRERLTISPCTRIIHGTWDDDWCLETEPKALGLPKIDLIYFATGVKPDFETISFLQNLRSVYGMRTIGGLPIINNDMMWDEDLPCFFTGSLAALRLGPGAANLAGARQGAERIAWKVEQLLKCKTTGHMDSCRSSLQQGLSQGEDVELTAESVSSEDVCIDSFSNQFEALVFSE